MIIEKAKMSSPAPTTTCQRFVRNAWKKDLCSNCFKPKEEHAPPPKVEINTLLTWELNDMPPLPVSFILQPGESKLVDYRLSTFSILLK